MKQYQITSANIPQDNPEDCYLAPDDPIQELKIAHTLGGLNAANNLAAYRASQLEGKVECDKGRYQRENNIIPGTPAWFELWRGNTR